MLFRARGDMEPAPMERPPPDTVTLVSGLPRSGTSMMMQMLAAGGLPILSDGERAADEDNPKGYLEFEAVKKTKEDASWVESAKGRAVKMIYALLPDLPRREDLRYQILFMDRPAEEVVKSQSVMLERRGEKGANLPPEKMAEIFAREVKRTFEQFAGRSDFQVLRIGYHEVLENPAAEAKRTAEFLEAKLDPEAMAGVVDQRLYRQRASKG